VFIGRIPENFKCMYLSYISPRCLHAVGVFGVELLDDGKFQPNQTYETKTAITGLVEELFLISKEVFAFNREWIIQATCTK